MSDSPPLYRACLTCGNLMSLQEGSKQVYCSPECSRENARCPVCGKYFEKGQGVAVKDGPDVCSADCAAADPRFDHLFKELS